jgi:hypothetical protein
MQRGSGIGKSSVPPVRQSVHAFVQRACLCQCLLKRHADALVLALLDAREGSTPRYSRMCTTHKQPATDTSLMICRSEGDGWGWTSLARMLGRGALRTSLVERNSPLLDPVG